MSRRASRRGAAAAAASSGFNNDNDENDFDNNNEDDIDDDDADQQEQEQNVGFLTGFRWVPHGFISPVPQSQRNTASAVNSLGRRLGISAEEMQLLNADGADDAAAGGSNSNNNDDDDDNDHNDSGRKRRGGGGAPRGAAEFLIGGQAADSILQEIESDDESEIDDTTIRPTDLVFVVSRAGDDPALELTIYDEPRDNIYVHHDASLVALPLCVEWLFESSSRSSLCAVGTMHPYIELWCLDLYDAVDPAAVLGGCVNPGDNYNRGAFSGGGGKRGGSSNRPQLKPESHTAAVCALAWNTNATTVLASGGADSFIKVWDISSLNCLGSTRHASGGRVQSLDWSPDSANTLLAGVGNSMDVIDCRTPDKPVVHWATGGADDNVEKAVFAPIASSSRGGGSGYYVVGSTQSGAVACFDTRAGSESAPVWALTDLHGGQVTFDVSRHSPLMATGGAKDGISLWDLTAGTGNAQSAMTVQPKQLSHRKLKVGQCFSLQFHPNSSEVLGAAGSGGLPLVYTITNDVNLGRARLQGNGAAVEEELQRQQDQLDKAAAKKQQRRKRGGGGGNKKRLS